MCSGDILVADFEAGTSTQPDLPGELGEHLTVTVDGLWVVWAYKLARHRGDRFIPLTGGDGYPADARAECRFRGVGRDHAAPQLGCTCGFHALSSQKLPGLPVHGVFSALTVALSGRVLAFKWRSGDGVLWRAERQTVVRIGRAALPEPVDEFLAWRRHPDDPEARFAAVPALTPRDSGPVRLELPATSPVVPVGHDDAGWCMVESRTPRPSPASLVLA
jgi:hypothetical protein